MYSLIGLATVIASASSAIAQTCFFPNGNEVPSDTACNPNALVSACCFDGQACLSNGLCVSNPNNTALARTHRGTCTDKAWKSGNCPRHCLTMDDSGEDVFSCNSTTSDSYCCFGNCECTDEWETFSFPGTPEDIYTVTIIGDTNFELQTAPPSTKSSIASISSSTATASNNPTDARTTTSSISPSTSTDSTSAPLSTPAPASSSNSAALGVGVGVGIGGAALVGAAVAAFLFYRRRKRNGTITYVADGSAAKPVEAGYTDRDYHPQPTKYAYYENGTGDATSKLSDVPSSLSEMPAQNHDPVELPTSPMAKR